jgi:glyoxylase-like metal-dependent hydrolase (beta-lactamase superfamily II)
MIVRFWGVRGSSPTPLGPEELRGKISAVLQRVKPADLVNSDARQRFLAKLPPDLFGTAGGNTACIEVRTAGGEMIILDMGTGLRELEKRMRKYREKIREFHIFISHFHYDHLLGLPYFGAMYDPESKSLSTVPIRRWSEYSPGSWKSPITPLVGTVSRRKLNSVC